MGFVTSLKSLMPQASSSSKFWGTSHGQIRPIRRGSFLLACWFLSFLLGRILARSGLLALLQLLLLLRVFLG